MIVSFMVISSITGCVDRMCQSFFQGVSFFILFSCFNDFSLPVGESISSRMIVELSVGYWA